MTNTHRGVVPEDWALSGVTDEIAWLERQLIEITKARAEFSEDDPQRPFIAGLLAAFVTAVEEVRCGSVSVSIHPSFHPPQSSLSV
jgi:hypothetical protein